MNKRIKKKLDNIRSGLFQPFFRKMAGWNEIEEQIDTLHYFLNNTVDITTLPKASGLLRKVQLVDTEVLRIVLQILKKNGIDCWLDYGTLLGAVRHKGFIPWDDDLDVAIKRCDYDKALIVLKNELDPYKIEIGSVTLGRIWIHIWKAGVMLDIFPMDCVAANSVSNYNELKAKVFEYRRYYNNHRNQTDLKLAEKREEIIGSPDYDKPLWYHNAEFNADGSIYDNTTIFPLVEMEFENYKFLVPNSCDEYLKQKYGSNYMDFPKTGVLHHKGGNDKGIYYNAVKSGTDLDELLKYLKEIQPLNKPNGDL